jgi:hypothetical protein
LNQHVKDALFDAGSKQGLLASVDVVAVANVAKYDWFPARDFVLKAVRDVVYLDFKGQLAQPPWSLPATTSTVVVLTKTGIPVKTFKGRLSDGELQQLFAAVEAQLAR